jgi:ppGpp synthetase/RelA/SpoT-type nucleotidyltranferase
MNATRKSIEWLAEEYRRRHNSVLTRLAKNLEGDLAGHLNGCSRVDRICARAKGVDRFLEKAVAEVNGTPKYEDPLNQIQDQIGARIVVFYLSDVLRIEDKIKKLFRAIEYRDVIPDSESEFGYFGRHLILVLPTDIIDNDMDRSLIPANFELQIKTLFQHAWSEADHDLGYKPRSAPLSQEQKRFIALASAQAWGADKVFEQLHKELSSPEFEHPQSAIA